MSNHKSWSIISKSIHHDTNVLMWVIKRKIPASDRTTQSETSEIYHMNLESIKRMLDRGFKEAAVLVLYKAMNEAQRSHDFEIRDWRVNHSTIITEMFVSYEMVVRCKPIVNFDVFSGNFDRSEHKLTFKEKFKFVKFVFVPFKIVYFEFFLALGPGYRFDNWRTSRIN